MEAITNTGNTPEAARVPWRLRLFGRLLESWVRIKRDPVDPNRLLLPGVPVIYVLERYGLSDALILEQACREAGLPSALVPPAAVSTRRKRSYFVTSLRNSLFWNRARRRPPTETLSELVQALEAQPELDIQLVPVSIFVGRAPTRQSGWFSVLFSENWVVVGRFRRLLALLLNGRDTHVQFSQPVSLRQVITEEQNQRSERTVRKIARVLRAHFRRIRTAIIGPDLSHRRTMVDAVLNAEQVRDAMAATAAKEALTRQQVWKRAHDYALEIAADYSHTVVRSLSFLLTSFWNKLYDGVTMRHFDTLRAVAPGHEVVYVPCHRSHIDYLLLSWLLYTNGIVPPHIAAGVNLNLPLIGPLLRRGGAFFLRRSFKANALYSAVFNEYVAQLFAQGVSMEYFIEGGRSRTGRLLQPKAGMLNMTIRAFLRESRRPVVFQPVYIGYEKLMEGKSYIGELSGQPKEKESLLGLLRSVKVLRQHYGRVSVNFGEPVFLTELLDREAPDWRQSGQQEKPEWLARAVDHLSERIQININRAADVNPINLLAVALLATPKHAMAESDLLTQLELYQSLLAELPYGDRVTLTEKTPKQVIAYGEQMEWIRRIRHPLGDVLSSDGKQGVLLSYFRNNVLHLFAASAWIACCLINNRRMARASVVRLARMVYPFIQAELFLPWNEEGFVERIQATIDFFIRRGVLGEDADGRVLNRGPGQGDAAFQLRTLAHSLLQAFERYYITIAVLVKNGRGALSAGELENLCTLTAQRLTLLHELNAPEFFDKSLFKGFIAQLRERRVIWTDDAGKLDFADALTDVARDAKVILSREIRHGILKLAPHPRATAVAESAAA
ncbi:glycerol-3-phosphate 1-O-acyltransferase PlsB [Tahibacter amnicola]|uniref:Glycerol-3-phosphate acyltransferase n=1 Tax=Tahibacter amnicola TaxID=2976241 RepID=A0ABY6BLA5_9GAMM|nr:glycerol-3-phosphate 1-O-acyltransferase PlsB [Tahibacter amnicola]UXI68592.1 glycerol-3-phosphate 1-O-acyltransferase PlsB [Tahibacter amnicola]